MSVKMLTLVFDCFNGLLFGYYSVFFCKIALYGYNLTTQDWYVGGWMHKTDRFRFTLRRPLGRTVLRIAKAILSDFCQFAAYEGTEIITGELLCVSHSKEMTPISQWLWPCK